MKSVCAMIMLLIASAVLAAPNAVKTERVTYEADGVSLHGYLAYPEGVTNRVAGVLVVHDWMGLADYAKRRAEQLAALGYVALAVDMYGDGKAAKDAAQAAEWSGALKKGDRSVMRKRALAALAVLKASPRVDPKRVGAIGYCFGGTVVLELVRSGAELDAAVSFHGGLDTPSPAEAGHMRASVLVCHGADDPYVSKGDVDAFQAEMRRAGADWQMMFYGDAVHSFSNPEAGSDKSKGAAYNALADRRSWELMQAFFKERLQ